MQSDNSLMNSDLPEPDDYALSLSRSLQSKIQTNIADNGGDISFAEYMRMALYEPGLGYYSAGASKFGESGDFITAPEVSSLFSVCLARQCVEVLAELKNPIILEFGAGTGLMACDIMKELERLNCLPDSYYILEPSADLRQRQHNLLEKSLPHLISKIIWLDTLPDDAFDGVILANEVLDAMPVHRFCVHKSELKEIRVVWENNEFVRRDVGCEGVLKDKTTRALDAPLGDYGDDYCSEINIDLDAWVQSISGCLRQGLILLIDYGYSRHEYYHQQRAQGTLLCHYRHRVHSNPFIFVGLQDITASVDFTAVAEAAVASKLSVSGFTTQAYFLFASGLDRIMQEQKDLSNVEQLELSRQIKTLTLPGEMGERFKVIALTRKLNSSLSGFSLVDHRRRL
jgi:SAM-dependent MidA family methyltransferase